MPFPDLPEQFRVIPFSPTGQNLRGEIRRSDPPTRLGRFRFARKGWRWESGKPVFGFPLFHPPRHRSCGNVGICSIVRKTLVCSGGPAEEKVLARSPAEGALASINRSSGHLCPMLQMQHGVLHVLQFGRPFRTGCITAEAADETGQTISPSSHHPRSFATVEACGTGRSDGFALTCRSLFAPWDQAST